MTHIIWFVLAAVAAMAIHEGGHYAAARRFGKRLKYRFEWGYVWKIPIPRWVWNMPYFFERWRRRVVALAGFGAELLAAPIFYCISPGFGKVYAVLAALHLVLYRFYAGEHNDFELL